MRGASKEKLGPGMDRQGKGDQSEVQSAPIAHDAPGQSISPGFENLFDIAGHYISLQILFGGAMIGGTT
jgi:hypothetical protein